MSEDPKGYRAGGCIYKAELLELQKRLGARGICLIVIGGKRNKDDVEISSLVPEGEVDFVARAMAFTALKMKSSLSSLVDEKIQL